MKKTYVLDTSVLVQAPHALSSFEDNHIVLPVAVLDEMESLKDDEGETGQNVRAVIRYLEDLRLKGDLVQGVALPGGGMLRIELNHMWMRCCRMVGTRTARKTGR